jgi:hypothetical protein
MATTTTTLAGLVKWDQLTDPYDNAQLENNFTLIDQHDHTSGKGSQIPTGGIADSSVTSAKIADATIVNGDIANSTIANAKLANSSITIGSTAVSLGATAATIAGITLTSPTISTITNNGGTLTLPTSSDTLVGKATSDTFTNKTYDTAGTGNVFKINGTSITDKTGTGKAVLDTSPTISGTSTSITNVGTFALRDTSAAYDVTITATSSTTLTAARTLTLDLVNSSRTFKLGGNVTTAANFTTSGANALTLTTTATTNATLPSGTVTLVATDSTDVLTNKTLTSPKLSGSSTGTTTIASANSGSTSYTLTAPAANDILVGQATTDVLTNKSLSDSTTYIVDATDNTKKLNIDVTGTTNITGVLQTAFTTAKTIAFPDTAGTVITSGDSETVTSTILKSTSGSEAVATANIRDAAVTTAKLSTTGIVAGTYDKLVVNTTGRVESGYDIGYGAVLPVALTGGTTSFTTTPANSIVLTISGGVPQVGQTITGTGINTYTTITSVSEGSSPFTIGLSRYTTGVASSGTYNVTSSAGDEYYYTADPTNGSVWHLRYSDPTNKWEYIGGAPLSAYKNTGVTSTFTSTSYLYDISTVDGPNIVIPAAGTYRIEFGADFSNSTNNRLVTMGLFTSQTPNAAWVGTITTGNGSANATLASTSSGTLTTGMTVTSANIPAGTTVIVSGSNITLSNAATATGTGTASTATGLIGIGSAGELSAWCANNAATFTASKFIHYFTFISPVTLFAQFKQNDSGGGATATVANRWIAVLPSKLG